MSGTKHTPTPWAIDRRAATAVRGASDFIVASTGGHSDTRRDTEALWNECVANAAHIVQCVNEHSALLTRVSELEAGLRELANRAGGLKFAQGEIVAAIGFTNWDLLTNAVNAADRLLEPRT